MALVIPKKPVTVTATEANNPNTPEPANSLAVANQSAIANNDNSNNDSNNQSQLDYIIESSLNTLISKLEAAMPDIRTEMITIHKALAKDPAQVTILTEEQQAAIFAGYSKLSGIELVAKAAAKRGSKQPISIEMFE